MDEAVIPMRSYSGGRPETAVMKKIIPDHISKNKEGADLFLNTNSLVFTYIVLNY
ncbi:hypothetical protein [Schaedlerella arabinosiphila]|uniref:hypothetical protein n=1 Tax=Schaedlerella arabinosiphila TaxID=2044587 RepID=UPI002151292C|nr:hypothetical protein [Schaedlerella arabinosiphila]